MGLWRMSLIPAPRHRSISSLRLLAVVQMMYGRALCSFLDRRMISRVAVIPSMTGIFTSINTTSNSLPEEEEEEGDEGEEAQEEEEKDSSGLFV